VLKSLCLRDTAWMKIWKFEIWEPIGEDLFRRGGGSTPFNKGALFSSTAGNDGRRGQRVGDLLPEKKFGKFLEKHVEKGKI